MVLMAPSTCILRAIFCACLLGCFHVIGKLFGIVMRINTAKDILAAQANERDKKRFWSRVVKTAGCWTFNSKGLGYSSFYISKSKMYAHRVSAIWAFGLPSQDLLTRHRCVNKKCVKPTHLEFGSHKDNALDAKRDGTCARTNSKGSANHQARITENHAVSIYRAYHIEGKTAASLASAFGVGLSLVRNLVSGYTWRHLTGSIDITGVDKFVRRSHGAAHNSAKLNEDNVNVIRKKFNKGMTHAALASEFEVTPAAIAAITQGRTWKHVDAVPTAVTLARAKRMACKPRKSLTVCDVKGIKILLRAKAAVALVAKKYGVSKATIYHIKNGRTWATINEQEVPLEPRRHPQDPHRPVPPHRPEDRSHAPGS